MNPCPFCGSSQLEMSSRIQSKESVHCLACGVYGPMGTKGTSTPVDRWNAISSPGLHDAYEQFKSSLIAQKETDAHLRNLCRMLIAETRKDEMSIMETSNLLNRIAEAVKL